MSAAVTVAAVEFVGLRSPLGAPATFSWGTATERNVGLVKVTTSDGTVGWGETSVTFPLWSLEERHITVRDGVAPLALGLPCSDTTEIASSMASLDAKLARLRLLWSPVGISGALGALEMALLDAWGKREQQPVWRLLGGSPAPVALYAVGFAGGHRHAAAAAAAALDGGYAAVKIRLGFGKDADLEQLATFRSVLGPDATVFTDVNMGWDRSGAAAMLPELARYDLAWLEEPLPHTDLEGLRQLRAAGAPVLAAGENCYTLAAGLELVASGAAGVVMPDLARCGGFLTGLAIARAALDAGLDYSPHHYASDIGFAAMVSLCAVAGPSRPALRDMSPWPLRGDLLSTPVEITEGRAVPSEEPGLAPAPQLSVIEETRVL